MNTNDLYLEYARVIQMCKGTELEDTPWVCVKREGVTNFDNHPKFSEHDDYYEFAVAVLEGLPVFVGDVVYGTTTGSKYTVHVREDGNILPSFEHMGLTWTPPTQKRTFTLNGVALPCPVDSNLFFTQTGFHIDNVPFCFESFEDAIAVKQALTKLLTESRDK